MFGGVITAFYDLNVHLVTQILYNCYRFMVFNATFYNISVISWWSVL